MTKVRHFFLLMACMLFAMPSINAGDILDNEGYPVMYIRGTLTDWAVADEYKFTREGDTYSIHLDALDGEFKISGTEWNYNLGSRSGRAITTSTIVNGSQDGLISKPLNSPMSIYRSH